MNCTEFEQRLRELVEARRGPNEPELRMHARACSACRSLWEENFLLDTAIRSWVEGIPPVDLAEAVVSQLAATETAGPLPDRPAEPITVQSSFDPAAAEALGHQKRRRAFGRLAGSIAALVLMAGVAISLFWKPEDRSVFVENDPPRHLSTDVAVGEGAELGNLLRDAGAAYWALAEGAAHAVKGAATIVKSAEQPELPLGDDQWIPEITSGWLSEWKQGLKPIGDDVAEAFQILLDTVPIASNRRPKT